MTALAEKPRRARRRAKSSGSDAPVEGGGNFLADRGHADPEETRLKFLMCNEIAVIIDRRGMTQAEAAEAAGLAQSDVSRIVNGNVKDYSVWRLMRVLNSLGKDVLVEFSDAKSERGKVSLDFHDRDDGA